MKVRYNHPAIPFDGIRLGIEYELTVKGNKAILARDNFSLEITKYQAENMFEEVKEISEKVIDN